MMMMKREEKEKMPAHKKSIQLGILLLGYSCKDDGDDDLYVIAALSSLLQKSLQLQHIWANAA